MTELKLNIYNDKKEVEKTLTTSEYDLMLGTCEDIMDIIDIDKINDNGALAIMIIKGYKQIKPLLKDIFADMTDEDLRGIKVKELVPLFFNVCSAIAESMGILKEGN